MNTVAVSRKGFRFCRWAVALMLWVSLALHNTDVLIAATAILGLNALVGVDRAPLVILWDITFGRLFPSDSEELVELSMRLAHALGAGIGACSLYLIFGKTPQLGWTLLVWFAAFKTAGALGFCMVSRLFTLAAEKGDCCRFLCGRLKKPDSDSSNTPQS